jgi:predicted transcriptional regulator
MIDRDIIKFYTKDLKIVYRLVKSEWKYILLTEDERKIYKFIYKHKRGITKEDLVNELDINMRNFYEAINSLIDKNLIEEKIK